MGIPRPMLLLLYEGFNIVFDQLLYPGVEAWFGNKLGEQGIAIGWAVMATLAMLQCAGFYYLYKRWKFDIAGVGYIEELPTKENKNLVERFIADLLVGMKKNDPRTFLLLILNVDPYLITVYYERDRYRSTRQNDWLVFGLVVVSANLWWGFRSALVALALLLILFFATHAPELVWEVVAFAGMCASILYSPNPLRRKAKDKSVSAPGVALDYSMF